MSYSKQDQLDRLELVRIADADERRRAIALNAAKIGIFEYEPASGRTFWDDQIREMFGVGPDEQTTYETVITRVHPDDRARHDAETLAAIDPKGSGHLEIEYRLLPQGDRPMRWVHAVATCHFEGDIPVRLVGAVQDVTARRTSEERNKMLLYELEHRVKNALTTAISVVRHSRVGITDVDTFVQKIEDRLLSMAKSHDVLRKIDWQTVPFADVLALEAEAFIEPGSSKLQFTGDTVLLPARHVTTIGMAVHELFTNASKYGALTQEEGRISVHLALKDDQAELTWTETGVPLTQPQSVDKGFGSLLLTGVVPAEMRGKVTYTLVPTGAIFKLVFPHKGSVFDE